MSKNNKTRTNASGADGKMEKYYTEGFIIGVGAEESNQKQPTIWFKPAPPFLMPLKAGNACLLMPESDIVETAKILRCEEKEQCKISIQGIGVSSAVALITSHQKLRITTRNESTNTFMEWRTV